MGVPHACEREVVERAAECARRGAGGAAEGWSPEGLRAAEGVVAREGRATAGEAFGGLLEGEASPACLLGESMSQLECRSLERFRAVSSESSTGSLDQN